MAAASFKKPLCFIPLIRITRISAIGNRIQTKKPEIFEFEIYMQSESASVKQTRNRDSGSGNGSMIGGRVSKISQDCWSDSRSDLMNSTGKLIFGSKDMKSFNHWVKSFESLLGY